MRQEPQVEFITFELYPQQRCNNCVFVLWDAQILYVNRTIIKKSDIWLPDLVF